MRTCDWRARVAGGLFALCAVLCAVSVMLLPGCGESAQPTPGAGGGGGGTAAAGGAAGSAAGTGTTSGGGAQGAGDDDVIPADAPRVTVLVIDERHTDTFARSLGDLEQEPPDAPFDIENGVVRWAHELAEETDAGKLEAARLTLGTPGTPLGRCTVLVVHTVRFTGKGRDWDEQRYFAFAQAPVSVPLSPGFTGAALAYDLETADGALPFVAMGVRLTPPDPVVRLESSGEAFTASAGGSSKPVTAGAPVDVWTSTRQIRVTEAAVKSTPIGGGAEVEITPAVDHGQVTFTTTVSVRLLGTFPGAPAVQPSTGGAL